MTFSSRDAACCDAHVRLTAAPAAAPLTLTSALGWSVPLQDRALPRLPRPDRPSWDARRIMRAARTLDEHSEIFHLTGGCHNAALLDRNGLVFFCMDIGRHNAIDTLIGYALRHRLNRRDLMILSSGRIASEIVHKALRAGFPVLASLSRAMAASIDLARACGLTLLGNVRDSGFDIYHDNGCLIL
ncbi:MAG: formate dehydrogenase accessory sulfurtransferase FdhD, partial [Desulfovibrio sp.]|uniref:formate dehydrogenase accessory sulfurtransferase FdhD n=1 Tax=Desulfovibrio sp. TaxID=885 RepID=UPI0025BB3267